MISRIVKCVVRLAVASLATGAVGACAAQVEPQGWGWSRSSNSPSAPELRQRRRKAAQQASLGAGRDTKWGEPMGQCKICTFTMSWQCVACPRLDRPQNV
jgi:hypothetical protein